MMKQKSIFVFLLGIFLIFLLSGLIMINLGNFKLVFAEEKTEETQEETGKTEEAGREKESEETNEEKKDDDNGIIILNKEQENLVCQIKAAQDCASPEVILLRMSGNTNAHAELPGQSHPNYNNNVICCSGITGLGNSCTGNYRIFLKLSGSTNAHVERFSQTNYNYNACISAPAGQNISILYQTGNCDEGYIPIASLSGSGITNAHIGGPNAYTTKICLKIVPFLISVAVSDGEVNYGIMALNASKDTTPNDLDDTQTAKNEGETNVDFNIRGYNTTCPWVLAEANGSNQYVHQFSKDGGTSWTALATGYKELAVDVPPDGTQNFDLRIIMPVETSCYGQQSVDVTVQAVQL